MVAAVYQLASADDRKVLERLLPGEAWHLGIPNPILSMFLKYDAAELLLSSVVAELDSAEAAIVESSREATLKRDGLENFHRGLRAHADHVTRTLRDWVSTWHAHPPIAYTS